MSSVFASATTPGSGVITKAQFTAAFNSSSPSSGFQQLGANATFSALDPNNTGAVSRQDFIRGMTGLMSQLKS